MTLYLKSPLKAKDYCHFGSDTFRDFYRSRVLNSLKLHKTRTILLTSLDMAVFCDILLLFG